MEKLEQKNNKIDILFIIGIIISSIGIIFLAVGKDRSYDYKKKTKVERKIKKENVENNAIKIEKNEKNEKKERNEINEINEKIYGEIEGQDDKKQNKNEEKYGYKTFTEIR